MAISAKTKRRLANFSLLLASTIISLLIAEVAVRWLLGQVIVLYPRNFAAGYYDGATLRHMVPNSTFWHTSIDGSWQFRINAQGFRDDESYPYEKPAGQRRILVMGDSHTEGYEVRQNATFSKVLERRLRERGLNAMVMNTGVSGFGTAEELMFLEHEGLKYHPDAVVVAFFANDFEDNVKSNLYRLEDGKLVVTNTSYIPGVKEIGLMNSVPGVPWLSENSYFFSLLLNTAWENAKQALNAMRRKQLTTEYAVRVSDVNKFEQQLAVALLERIKADAHQAGIPFIIVEIPSHDPSGRAPWLPSISPDLVPSFVSASDVFVPASSYLAGMQGLVHVPHGHRHISEETHARIAEALDRVFQNGNFQIQK